MPKKHSEARTHGDHRLVKESISVILPVRNAQATLLQEVSQMLDVLPDVAARFELILVDDASTDRTEEVACELTRTYPQVRFVRHHDSRGNRAAVQTGLEHATAETVLVQGNPLAYQADVADELRMTDNCSSPAMQAACDEPETMNSTLMHRLLKWSNALEQEKAACI
jgi:hypothetical protein